MASVDCKIRTDNARPPMWDTDEPASTCWEAVSSQGYQGKLASPRQIGCRLVLLIISAFLGQISSRKIILDSQIVLYKITLVWKDKCDSERKSRYAGFEGWPHNNGRHVTEVDVPPLPEIIYPSKRSPHSCMSGLLCFLEDF